MVGLVAAFEVTRPVRWLNLPIGLVLALVPLVWGDVPAAVNGIATGLALAALACVRGQRAESFGGGWRSLWDPAAGRG